MSTDQDGLIMKYFVLKPAGTSVYAMASREAMRTYAEAIAPINPKLSCMLYNWADSEMRLSAEKQLKEEEA